MQSFKRVGLFLLTNLLVMVTVGIVFSVITQVFHLERYGGYIPYLIVFSAVWGMGGAFVSLLISKFIAKKMMGVKVIDPNSHDSVERSLLNTVHTLAEKAGIKKMPEVGIYDAPEINAFATGPSRNNALVAVSTGLLRAMGPDEIEGVLGHELAHVANGDMVTMTLIQGVVNSFVLFFSRVLAQIISQNFEEKSRYLVRMLLSIVFDIAFTMLGSIVVMYFSRQREFRADAGGARYAGRGKMVAGLKRLQQQFDRIQPDTNQSMATLKITSRPTGLMGLMRSHPSLEERIARLESMPA
jgi:heat shock protein HtpX